MTTTTTLMVDELIEKIGRTKDRIVPLLLAVLKRCNYLPDDVLQEIIAKTDIDHAQMDEVVGFYHRFRTKPAGKHRIAVCTGTACHVQGAPDVIAAFRTHLGISDANEDTDAELRFTVDTVGCLGCCSLAPAVQIDDIIYGHVEPQKVGELLQDFQASAIQGQPQDGDEGEPLGLAACVQICRCAACAAAGARKIDSELRRQRRTHELPMSIREVACDGNSYQAPALEIVREDGTRFRYGLVTEEQVEGILLRHLRPASLLLRIRAQFMQVVADVSNTKPPVRHLAREGERICSCSDMPRIVTEGAGELSPLDLTAYQRAGGFAALRRALTQAPQALIDEVLASGLCGRGGGGFPTGKKWQMVRDATIDPEARSITDRSKRPAVVEECQQCGEAFIHGEPSVSATPPAPRKGPYPERVCKYIICNGDEGDPGAFMDRMLLESFPYRVLEGMCLAAYAVGASEGIFYVRDEYPEALRRLRLAIDELRAAGMIGGPLLGTGPVFDITISPGAGAFVCGEETALISSIEGLAGRPRKRPPYPAEKGLFGKPTLVNNVETLANLPWIILHGQAAFRALGTERSSGTKTFALAGKINNGGLVEVPMGTTIRQLVDDIGGGIPGGRAFKAVQIGGPAGGCIPASLADMPIDFQALREAGAIMGSGGLVVLDDDDCMVDVALYFMTFTGEESCGKCAGCRDDTQHMRAILESLCQGTAAPDALDQLIAMADKVRKRSLCGLGVSAPNPVLSSLRHFREEFEAHLAGRCPAGKCKALVDYHIDQGCIGCTKCAQVCPVQAIELKPYQLHTVDNERCTRCGMCREVCPLDVVRTIPHVR